MNNATDPVSDLLAAYAAAVRAKDADAFAALYADDVHVFDAWAQWQYTGIDAWRGMAAGWFGSLGDKSVDVEFTDVRSVVGENVAFGHASVTFVNTSAGGERLRSMTNRFTVALERQYGRWSVVHEHSSLPIDLETGTAIAAR